MHVLNNKGEEREQTHTVTNKCNFLRFSRIYGLPDPCLLQNTDTISPCSALTAALEFFLQHTNR